MNSPTIHVSTACLARHFSTLAELLAAYAAAGLERIEFGHVPPLGEFSPAVDLRRFVGRALIHNYFPPPAEPFVVNLASRDPVNLARSREFCLEGLRYSAGLAAPCYSIHCGFLAEFSAGSLGHQLAYASRVPYEEGYQIFSASLHHLLPVARELGIRLLLEPNVVAPFNLVDGRNELLLLAEPAEFRRLLGEFPDSMLGVLLDVGHLKVTARTLGFGIADFIAAVHPRIGAFHLHDNDGLADQHLQVLADAWMIAMLREPEHILKPVIVEAGFPSVRELASHVRWLDRTLSN